eukprot:6204387-Pleurochrysis_carterae.AAC.3
MRVLLLLNAVALALCPRGLPTPWQPSASASHSAVPQAARPCLNASHAAFGAAALFAAAGAALAGTAACGKSGSSTQTPGAAFTAKLKDRQPRPRAPFQRPCNPISTFSEAPNVTAQQHVLPSASPAVASAHYTYCDDTESIHSDNEDDWADATNDADDASTAEE